MPPHHRPRRTSLVAAAALTGALLLGAQPATAAPTDTVFPIPVAAFGFDATGLPSSGYMFMTATTDPETPGVTRFTGGGHCCVFIHWRNVSTGEAGIAYLESSSVDARTGSGTVLAAVTTPEYPGWGVHIVAALPGAGVWTVP
ncbi:hypothetical protein [Prescottella agglutinans]|uniref:hypothetical protein n=1 Tax=Prescottella agglutinans TaxID=1644129 RepID=UPI003D98A45B